MQDKDKKIVYRPEIAKELHKLLDKQCNTCEDYVSFANTALVVAEALAIMSGRDVEFNYIRTETLH